MKHTPFPMHTQWTRGVLQRVVALASKQPNVGSQLCDVLPKSGPVLPVRGQILGAIVQGRMLLLQEAHLVLETFVLLGQGLLHDGAVVQVGGLPRSAHATIPPRDAGPPTRILEWSPGTIARCVAPRKQKGGRVLTAVCALYTHPLGWDLQLTVDDRGLVMSDVVGSADEMIATSEEWRAAMLEKGWS
jgi:hypothetical protein